MNDVLAAGKHSFVADRPSERAIAVRATVVVSRVLCDDWYPAVALHDTILPPAAGGVALVYCILQPVDWARQ